MEMDVVGAIGGLGAILFLLILGMAVFTVWMFIHAMIRTIKMWPQDNVLNILMVLLIVSLEVIGAIVYYFVCYKKGYEPKSKV